MHKNHTIVYLKYILIKSPVSGGGHVYYSLNGHDTLSSGAQLMKGQFGYPVFNNNSFWTVQHFIFLTKQERKMHFHTYLEIWKITTDKIISY